ncbi:MGMT family protein [Streptomyces sp. NBC_00704]
MQMRGRTVCPTGCRGARVTQSRGPVALSVPWGRMGRMSEQSLPDDARPEYTDALPEYAERVLEVAELIPPGRVMTYGDVAEWLQEGGPRQVGRVMALYGGAAPWWRVVRADGVLLPGHELRALNHYRAEGTPLKEASRAAEGHVPRLDMRRARWDGGQDAEGHT